jgi:hypothetical protein
MILPSKHLSEDRALITIGAEVLRQLDQPKTVSRLWAELKRGQHAAITYDWFVLGLDLLYTIGVVEFSRGRVARTGKLVSADRLEELRHD